MLSFVIPAMNECNGIKRVISDIKAKAAALDYEVIVIDTNSTDGTPEAARELGAVVIDEPRRGYGRAYKTGFSEAKGDIIITLDADGTYPLDSISEAVRILQANEADFITCNRFGGQETAMKLSHRFGNYVLSFFTRALFGIRISDSQSGMWIFKKNILPKLNLTADGMAFSEEIKIEAFSKVKSAEIPINYMRRIGDVKLRMFGDGFGNLKFLFKTKFFNIPRAQ